MATAAPAKTEGRLIRYRPEMVHALRMTAASVTAYAATYVLGLSEGLWAVITAIIVTQSSIGGSLRVAFDQFVGSLFGAIYATAIVLLISPNDYVWSTVALVAALAPLSFLAAFSPGFRIAPITGAIMLLGGAELGLGPLDLAMSRLLEVGLGCGVAVLGSIVVAPARASRSVLATTAHIADLLAEQLGALASRSHGRQAELGSLAVRIRENLIRLEALVNEAARERRIWLTDVPDTEPLLRTMRRLRHDVAMLRRAAREVGSAMLDEHTASTLLRAVDAGAAALRRVSQVLSGQEATRELTCLAETVHAYRMSLDEMRRSGLTQPLSTAALGRLFGIAFALDQFRRNLEDLIERCSEIAARQITRDGSLAQGVSTSSGPWERGR